MANIVQEQCRNVQEITLQNVYTSRNNTGASVPRHGGTQTIREEYVDPSIMVNNFREQEITMREQATAFVRIERSSTSTPCEYDSNHGSHAIGGTDAEAAQFSSPHVQEINMQDLSSSGIIQQLLCLCQMDMIAHGPSKRNMSLSFCYGKQFP
jgi:hypothetical protein